jgi:hypothetical protein
VDQDDDPALAETQSPALAARPPADRRVREVARAKIANALFAAAEAVTLGRYDSSARRGRGDIGFERRVCSVLDRLAGWRHPPI